MVGIATPVQAATGNILPPFDVGQTWCIYQGYDSPWSHNNNGAYPSQYGLDLTGADCGESSATGKTVRAPLGGTASYSSDYGSMCINTSDGRSIALTHINSSIPNGPVSAGQIVGTVAAAGLKNNNGVAHIHLQIWSSGGCWSTGNGGMPFDTAHNARICGAQDLTATGPNARSNGTWSGTSFNGDACGVNTSTQAQSMRRIAIVAADATAYAKEGNIDTAWVNMLGPVSKVVMSGTRFAALATNGILYVKDGGLGAPWVNEYSNVTQVSMSGNRIGILTTNGDVFVKEGDLGAPWIQVMGGATKISISGNRIGVITGNTASVKEGGIGAPWVTMLGGVKDMDMSANRVGVLTLDGTLYVKDGGLGAPWVNEYGSVSKLALSGNRIGLVTTNGDVLVKEGDLGAPWVYEYGGVIKLSLSGNRVGVLTTNSDALVKEGYLDAPWVTVLGGVTDLNVSA